MNIFPLRRRDALAQLRLSEDDFGPLPQPEPSTGEEPEEFTTVSPANELATSLVEHDIAEAVRTDNPPPAEPIKAPAPLSQRHLETIDRMVAHLKGDEKRLEEQIVEAKRQLADTQLARRGYERNSAELRRGISVLMRLANVRPPAPRQPRAPHAAAAHGPREAARGAEASQGAAVTTLKPRRLRKMH